MHCFSATLRAEHQRCLTGASVSAAAATRSHPFRYAGRQHGFYHANRLQPEAEIQHPVAQRSPTIRSGSAADARFLQCAHQLYIDSLLSPTERHMSPPTSTTDYFRSAAANAVSVDYGCQRLSAAVESSTDYDKGKQQLLFGTSVGSRPRMQASTPVSANHLLASCDQRSVAVAHPSDMTSSYRESCSTADQQQQHLLQTRMSAVLPAAFGITSRAAIHQEIDSYFAL